jgi:hypothetical protein
MNEDVNSVSPTLGFIIKTIDYEGSVDIFRSRHESSDFDAEFRIKLQIEYLFVQLIAFPNIEP